MFDEWEFLLVIDLTQHLIAARKLLHFYHLPVFRPSHIQPAFPQKDTDPKNGSRNITFSERLSVSPDHSSESVRRSAGIGSPPVDLDSRARA
jgi:hypothetical protein